MKALRKENHKTIIINQERMKSKRVNLPYKLFSQGYLLLRKIVA